MSISVDPLTYIISVSKADLVLVQASPEVRALDLDIFRLELKGWEDDVEGIVQPKTHTHNTEVTLSGLNYARTIEILPPYTVEFEDEQYSVNCSGANHNLSDVKVVNQVSLVVNNAAGLISSPDIEYASFQSGVWIDTVTGNDDNKGNEQLPVKTIERALIVASYRGFKKLYAQSNITIGTGHNFDDFLIQGQSHVITQLTIEDGASCERLTIDNCNVTGVLDGDNEIRNCVVGDIVYFNGHIHNSGLHGMFYLDGANYAVIADCSTLYIDDPPIIDMGGSGQSLAMPNYSGLVTIQNFDSDTDSVGVGLNAGMVFIDSTVIDGTLIISGTGTLTHTQTGSEEVNSDGLLNKNTVGVAVWDEPIGDHLFPDTMGHQMYHQAYAGIVHVNAITGAVGTTFPTGTSHEPCSNLSDALVIANSHFINTIHFEGTYEIDHTEDLAGITLAADRSLGNELTITSMVNSDACYFQNLTVSGALVGSTRFTECVLGALTGFDGGAKDSLVTDSIGVTGLGANYLTNCDTYSTDDTVFKSISVGDHNLNLIRCEGNYEIADKTGTQAIVVSMISGDVKIASSCVAGSIHIEGISEIVDESGAGCTVDVEALSSDNITNSVWDEPIADHLTVGSTGAKLNVASSGGVDYTALADAVWDASIDDHLDEGSTGNKLNSGGSTDPIVKLSALTNL